MQSGKEFYSRLSFYLPHIIEQWKNPINTAAAAVAAATFRLLTAQ
jgi:hypothetical protein